MKHTFKSLAFALIILTACGGQTQAGSTKAEVLKHPKWSTAVFAGGCFWCMEPPFDKLKGVKATISGYTGGPKSGPTYKQVANGLTQHKEAVLVRYDKNQVSYEKLLEVFWRQIDPTQADGQFVDRGAHYTSAIYYLNKKQELAAEKSKSDLAKSGKFSDTIVTEIIKGNTFWRAEEYHQDFYKKNPSHYYNYRKGSGRDDFIKKVWGSAN